MQNDWRRSKNNQCCEKLSLLTCMGVPLISSTQYTLRSTVAETNAAVWWQSNGSLCGIQHSRQKNVWLTVGECR